MTWKRLIKNRGKTASLISSITIQNDFGIFLSAALGFQKKRSIDILFDTEKNKLALIELDNTEGSRNITKQGKRGMIIRAKPLVKLFNLQPGQRFIGTKEVISNGKEAWVFDLNRPE